MANEVAYQGKGQALRLGLQQELGGGPATIFGDAAQKHDLSIRDVALLVLAKLAEEFPDFEFRQRNSLTKKEINEKLSAIDDRLGQALFVGSSSIKPDGAITEVLDRFGNWRVVLVGESKHQGNDVEKIIAGVKQGKNKDQDFMVAGNAIERVHKNILEIRNFMLNESHFPYVVFLQGSNFATETFLVEAPDGRKVVISHTAGMLNRIDRVTASNFCRAINTNCCENIVVKAGDLSHILHSPSLYFQATPWSAEVMFEVMHEVAKTSLTLLAADLP